MREYFGSSDSCRMFGVSNKNKHKHKHTENMTITNENMTIQDARNLTKTVDGSYVATAHNKKMVANAAREIIARLHGEKPHYIK